MALVEVSATAAGLTTATTAYTAGDMLGTQWSFLNAVATSGGYGYVEKVVVEDDSNVVGGIDIFMFNATVTQAADNAAASWSDADAAKCVGVLSVPGAISTALNREAIWEGSSPFKLAGTTLFCGFVTRSAHTFFASGATALHVIMYINQQ
jgi:hypothetical protein